MNSDNSGSQQSSSGGDEEYDSRAATADSIFAFMNIHPTATVPHVGLAPNPSLLDPIPNYPEPNPLLNSNMLWPRSDPIPNYSAAFMNSPFQAENFGDAAPPAPLATAGRNPKKRSRASRRAPTTVLTTDTTNFRAMVQEFTGIPAPPFSSPLSRNRIDLSSLTPSYLRRPFPQKAQSPPSTFPLSASSSIQQPFPQNLYNISNPVLTSLLQSNTKFPFPNSCLKPIEIPSILGHGNHEPILQNLITSNQNAPRNDQNRALSPDGDNRRQGQTGFVNGNYGSFPGNPSINYSDSSSNFQVENGTENVTTTSEGMMEPWICSSE